MDLSCIRFNLNQRRGGLDKREDASGQVSHRGSRYDCELGLHLSVGKVSE